MESNSKIFSFLLITQVLCAHADLYDQKPSGFVWYDDRMSVSERASGDENVPVARASAASGKTAKETLRFLGEQYEEAESLSILNPTTENVKKAITLKKEILVLTQTYADRYEQVVWRNPELDYTLERPMRTDGIFLSNPLAAKRLSENLQVASKHYALIYVFRSDCPYCRRFSPILKGFSQEHGFAVLPVSLDGKGGEEFPYPKRDLSALKRHGLLPEVVPALYLVNPNKDEVEAVGFGLMNSNDLERRVALAAGINVYEGAPVATRVSGE